MKDGDKDYKSMLPCYYVEKSDELKECAKSIKDKANERNESWHSNCRVQLILCKTIIK